MTDSQPRPAIRKAPDTDRHPALAAHPQVDLHEETVGAEVTAEAKVTAKVEASDKGETPRQESRPDTDRIVDITTPAPASQLTEGSPSAPKKSRWSWFFSRS